MGDALIWIAGVVIFLALLHFVASWAERSGWIIYRKSQPGNRGRGVALSNAMAELEVLLSPAAEHRIEEERSSRVVRDQATAVVDDDNGTVYLTDN